MIKDILQAKDIRISLNPSENDEYLIGWEIEQILNAPDVFDDFYEKNSLDKIEDGEDYYLYLLSCRFASYSNNLFRISDDEKRQRIIHLSESAKSAVCHITAPDIIRYINTHFTDIFDQKDAHDIRCTTLILIRRYFTGISDEALAYVCRHHNGLIIGHYDEFSNTFENKPELFDSLFPNGHLSEINPFNLHKVLDIWSRYLGKQNSPLKAKIEAKIPVLYSDICNMASTLTIDNVMQHEGIIRHFFAFLKKAASPLANDFGAIMEHTNALLSEHIHKDGCVFQYDIPVNELFAQWNNKECPIAKLLCITHTLSASKEETFAKSLLDDSPSHELSLVDLVSTNINTDSYFTVSHQQKLSITIEIGGALIWRILQENSSLNDYLSLIVEAAQIIGEKMEMESEVVSQDMEMITQMISFIADNKKKEADIIHPLNYGTAMFTITMCEKILRTFYIHLKKHDLYVPQNQATIGDLLTPNNAEISNVFGVDHIRNLGFFFIETPPNHVGKNIRNRLAHWSNISTNEMTTIFTCKLLWLFTDILNTILWYFLSDNKADEK